MKNDTGYHRDACYRCGHSDLLMDPEAAELVCRRCGEVQRGRLLDREDEFPRYLNDDSKSAGANLQRSSSSPSSISGDSCDVFVMRGGGGWRGGASADHLAALTRSANAVRALPDRAVAATASICRDIAYSLNLHNQIAVS
jgi:transcription initiation factor TFIIIB Brf1 subunit/transcription initiation factor TFIIB